VRRGHADHRRGEAEGRDDGLADRSDGGAIADAAEDGLLVVAGDAGSADLVEFLEEPGAVGNGVLGAPGEPIDLENPVGEGAVLEGGNGLAHGAAMRRQNAADAVGHADLVEALYGVEHMDVIIVKISHAGGLIESMGKALEFRADFVAESVGLLNEPAEAELGSELVGAVDRLLEVAVFFEGEEDTEESGFGQASMCANVFEGQGGLAVEAVEDLEGAAYGPHVVLFAGGGVGGGLERPFGNAAANGLFGCG